MPCIAVSCHYLPASGLNRFRCLPQMAISAKPAAEGFKAFMKRRSTCIQKLIEAYRSRELARQNRKTNSTDSEGSRAWAGTYKPISARQNLPLILITRSPMTRKGFDGSAVPKVSLLFGFSAEKSCLRQQVCVEVEIHRSFSRLGL